MMKGAKMEYIETHHGDLLLMTSDDPNLIAEIQNWAKHTEEEMKKIAECEKHKKEKKAE
jgi:TusA-related sulfurtransferase